MKTILLFSILFCSCTIVFPSLGALTDADLDKIRLIVKDEVKSEINASEKRMKEYINIKNESIDDKFEGINGKFEGIEKNFDRQNNIIIACIGIPMAILAIGAIVWGILTNRRSPKVNEQREQLEEFTREDMEKLFSELTLKDKRIVEQLIRDQEQKIEDLIQEIETLKQQRTVNP